MGCVLTPFIRARTPEETITVMRKLDVKEIHGYHAVHGRKLLKPDMLAKRRANGRL